MALLGTLGTALANTATDGRQAPVLPQGLSVWDNALYVHHTDTLLIRGDVFLFAAHIQGNGSLLVQDTVSRTITAHESSLPHLIIDNPYTVSLQGQLHIRAGLVLASGVFDTRAASFTLSDSATVHLLPGSQWLKQDMVAIWQPFLPLFPPGSQQGQRPLAVPPPSLPTETTPLPVRQLVGLDFSSLRLTPGWKSIPHPPPQADGKPTA